MYYVSNAIVLTSYNLEVVHGTLEGTSKDNYCLKCIEKILLCTHIHREQILKFNTTSTFSPVFKMQTVPAADVTVELEAEAKVCCAKSV